MCATPIAIPPLGRGRLDSLPLSREQRENADAWLPEQHDEVGECARLRARRKSSLPAWLTAMDGPDEPLDGAALHCLLAVGMAASDVVLPPSSGSGGSALEARAAFALGLLARFFGRFACVAVGSQSVGRRMSWPMARGSNGGGLARSSS